jgi:hypothetical protein
MYRFSDMTPPGAHALSAGVLIGSLQQRLMETKLKAH